MSHPDSLSFSPVRSFFWPIHRNELRKFIPMLIMLFFVCFNYSILRNMKDSIVVTASGATVLPFIKVWMILPCAILITVIFTKLSNRLSQERVFYIFISTFLIFFTLFAYVLYPLRDMLHPYGLANYFETILPLGFHGFIEMCCNWTFTLFYVMCELWGSLVMTVLFWGFANEITRIHEARRFYSVLSIFSNIAAICAGQAANYFADKNSIFYKLFSFTSSDDWERSMMSLIFIVVVSGIITMYTFRWMNKNVLTDQSFDELHQTKRDLKKKGRLSIKDSFSYLSNSKYLTCIAFIVLGYNLTINLAEVVYKERLRELYPLTSDYNVFLNNVTTSVGVVSTIMAIFMAKIISRFGWTRTALITPVIMLVTVVGFFSFLIFQDSLGAFAMALTGLSPLVISVYFGAAQNCFSKAMKYSVFDATKEMTFIPLDHEVKLKGKAAIDGVGSRLGKSGGSFLQQGLIVIFGSLTASASYVAFIIIAAIVGWVYAVKALGKEFTAIVKSQDRELAEGETSSDKDAATVHAHPVEATLR